MGNYKPWGHDEFVGFDGYYSLIPSGGKFIALKFNNALATTSVSVFQGESWAAYVVPTGKKYVMKGIKFMNSAAAGNTVNLHTGDTLNATTTLRDKFVVQTTVGGLTKGIYTNPTDIEFAAGKYITITPITTNIYQTEIIGYEIDE